MTETDLEQRLRGALHARAAAVTSRDLRHEQAPSRLVRPAAPARWWLPMTAGLAAAAVSITAFALLRPADSTPVPPAAPPSPTRTADPSPPVAPSSSPVGAQPGSMPPAVTPSRSSAPAVTAPVSPRSVSPRSVSTAGPIPTASAPRPAVEPGAG
ncbi:hypothetical protein Acy02nite_48760 [Actinoplanes cyaneus]|uniref:Uncharacterized protein n=1 Tax=Actinoplanes cyaneus TaxID=52696 RepID=A0A919M290_9ACTN|nr:hypothetical protein [Actinoplanes cyaneus]GID66995.1 hypothetical protein Acy02nite_48760 [Actinoplanes cyaneus]